MATYAIGDVQGCCASLQALLVKIAFHPQRDRLYFLGDLVNRGPDSLGVLRLLQHLGDAATSVLGNHDIHLIARATGVAPAKPRDTLDPVLAAPDLAALLDWLLARPLLMRVGERVLVHAGLLPAWTIATAEKAARAVEHSLRSPTERTKVLSALQTKEPLAPVRILTTIRTCDQSGMPSAFSGPPEDAPAGCVPWFAHPQRQSRGTTVVFGHWSALGVKQGDDYMGLDSGCVWGQRLTAQCLEDGQLWSVPSLDAVPR